MTSPEATNVAGDVALEECSPTLVRDLEKLEITEDVDAKKQVEEEEKKENGDCDEDAEEIATTDDNPKVLRKSSSSFMRAHDLEIPQELQTGGSDVSSSSSLQALLQSTATRLRGPDPSSIQGMFFIDQDLKLVLNQLVQLGYQEATDEGARFVPGRETTKVLKLRAIQPIPTHPEWPIPNWNAANASNLNEILIWNGMVSSTNTGYGADWPVIKARGIVPTSPRNMVEFLWDSKNVPRYNTMSQGREDVLIWQDNIDTKADESPYGFPGCAKVMKSYNKIKMVPRLIETVSILHARPLEPPLAAPGTFIVVNRSIWESDNNASSADDSETSSSSNDNHAANANSSKHKVVRNETFLGVQLLRPIMDGKACELTTITHASAPGVNKTMARTAANVSAAKIIRDIQALLMS